MIRSQYSPQIQDVNESFQLYLSEYQPLKDNKLSSQAGMLCSEMCIYIWQRYAGNA